MAYFGPESVAQFAPESVAYFGAEWVAQFGPEYAAYCIFLIINTTDVVSEAFYVRSFLHSRPQNLRAAEDL